MASKPRRSGLEKGVIRLMLHCPLKSDIKWKNPDGIFPDGLDMVRPAAKFKPSQVPPKKTPQTRN
jgi:hypothetical protein